jgi:hypothetical protein
MEGKKVTNALAYCDMELITSVKYFILQNPDQNGCTFTKDFDLILWAFPFYEIWQERGGERKI